MFIDKGGSLLTILLAVYYESMIRNNGQAVGYNEFYQVSAAKHLAKAAKVSFVNNLNDSTILCE